MSQSELLGFLVYQPERSRIPYTVTGSVVSSLEGEPPSTLPPATEPVPEKAFDSPYCTMPGNLCMLAYAGVITSNGS